MTQRRFLWTNEGPRNGKRLFRTLLLLAFIFIQALSLLIKFQDDSTMYSRDPIWVWNETNGSKKAHQQENEECLSWSGKRGWMVTRSESMCTKEAFWMGGKKLLLGETCKKLSVEAAAAHFCCVVPLGEPAFKKVVTQEKFELSPLLVQVTVTEYQWKGNVELKKLKGSLVYGEACK
jgi:hypothetical protein